MLTLVSIRRPRTLAEELDVAQPSLIGRRIKAYRQRAKMTQQQLADATGIPRSHISVVEAGIRQGVSVENLIRIADAMGLSVDQLVRPSPNDDPVAANI
jgi:transcriptional regulator with XRE-family HTH domain